MHCCVLKFCIFSVELKETLLEKSEEILSQQHQLKYWRDYRDRGQEEQKKQIQLLRENNADMETTFETMTGVHQSYK